MLRKMWKQVHGLHVSVAGLLALPLLVGCHSDKPHDYGRERPPVEQLDPRDKGLQSADVTTAADQMAADLLADPKLNASRTQWTIVVTSMDDKTRDRMFRTDYDIFLQALKSRLFQQSKGRVTLIQNRDKFYQQRNKELEGGGKDEFGQGGGGVAGAPQAVSPDYALTGVVRDLPRRGTIYYQMEFSLDDLHTRTQAWLKAYEVKVAR